MGRDSRSTMQDMFTVMRDRSLSAEEKVVWALLRSHETQSKGAFPGDERLASMMDKSPRSVERYRRRLLEGGYLEQQLRGPKPAMYRAVLPPESPDTTGDPSDEREDTGSDPTGSSRSDTDGESYKAPPKDPPNDSPSDSPLVSPEYGENGEYGEKGDAGGSFLRSSPPGEGAGVENSRDEARSEAIPSREDLLEGGNQRIAAWILPLHRKLLYPPDGHPPEGYDDGRDVTVYRTLLERGRTPEEIEVALEGLAYARDNGELACFEPGEKVTARALQADLPGGLNALVHFQGLGRRCRAGELAGDDGREEGLTRLASVLADIAPRSGPSPNGEQG